MQLVECMGVEPMDTRAHCTFDSFVNCRPLLVTGLGKIKAPGGLEF